MADQTTSTQPSPYSHTCTNCGAATQYAPGTHALRCPYCGHQEQIAAPSRPVREHAFAELMTRPPVPAASLAPQQLVCQRCGAHLQGGSVSQRCQFCTAPLVVNTAMDHQIPPEAVLPFALDRSAARGVLNQWAKSRWFAPNRLKKVSEAETMSSTYLPHWTFDARTVSHYTGQRGEHYWATETYTETVNGQTQTRTRQVRRTRWYPVSGTVARNFDDVVVPGTRQVTPEKLDKLDPWPLNYAVPFQPGYVAGHESLRYDVEPQEGLGFAQQKMAQVIRGDCHRDIGGDEQQVHSVNTNYADVTGKLMLLPVWIGSYLYSGKPWQVLINGCTGEVQGERPFSVLKIVSAAAAAIALIAAIVGLIILAQH
jgi:DNA-directed RNA polymerase subunit RPC12/RpoP